MRLPDGNVFINGNPNGGTIVTAEFLNAIVGELVGLLELGGLQPLAIGDLPDDHRQLRGVFSQGFLRVGELDPQIADDGAVYLNLVALLEGQWPFYISRSGVWEATPTPLILPEAEAPEEVVFNDEAHGFRGGGDLHSVATEFSAGFMSPEGVKALNRCTASIAHQLTLPAVQMIAYSRSSSPAATLSATRLNWGAAPFGVGDHTFKVVVSHQQIMSYFQYFNAGVFGPVDFAGGGALDPLVPFNAAQAAIARGVLDLGRGAAAADLRLYAQAELGVSLTIFENPKLDLLRELA